MNRPLKIPDEALDRLCRIILEEQNAVDALRQRENAAPPPKEDAPPPKQHGKKSAAPVQ